LWEEITLLTHFCDAPWVVENVNLYYKPIIEPAFKLDRHTFWSNFYAPPTDFKGRGVTHKNLNGANHTIYGVNIAGFDCPDKRRLLRNMVNPEVGEYIFNTAMGYKTQTVQMEMFG